MTQKTFNTVAGIVFVIVAVLHLLRFLYRSDVVLGIPGTGTELLK